MIISYFFTMFFICVSSSYLSHAAFMNYLNQIVIQIIINQVYLLIIFDFLLLGSLLFADFELCF